MPVDDLWYLSKRGPDGKRLPSKRHGRGKRWRVRYKDAAGVPRERLFDKKADAERWDAAARSGAVSRARLNQSEHRLTFREYGERWRLSREIGLGTGNPTNVWSRTCGATCTPCSVTALLGPSHLTVCWSGWRGGSMRARRGRH